MIGEPENSYDYQGSELEGVPHAEPRSCFEAAAWDWLLYEARRESSKLQHPSTREAPNSKHQGEGRWWSWLEEDVEKRAEKAREKNGLTGYSRGKPLIPG